MHNRSLIEVAKEHSLGSKRVFADKRIMCKYYYDAHREGDIRGSFYYALCLFEGTGIEKDKGSAFQLAKPSVETMEALFDSGDYTYVLQLADAYSFGLARPQNFEKAFNLYRLAVEEGSIEAECNLGYMYSVGQGVAKNEKKAFLYWKSSADKGYLHSIRDVALMYLEGRGTNRDYVKAIQYLTIASEHNYAHATCDLANCYRKGTGVKRNLEEATRLYLQAYSQDRTRTVRDLITEEIDVLELLHHKKIVEVKRDSIESFNENNYFEGVLVVNQSITHIDTSCFYSETGLVKIFVSYENPVFSSDSGVLFSKDKKQLVRYPLGAKETSYTVPSSVEVIGDYAFQNCKNLRTIQLHDGIISIGTSAFDDCKHLVEIELPSQLEHIGDWAFHGCDMIQSFRIPASTQSIGTYAFGSCESLANIHVDSNNVRYASREGNFYSKDYRIIYQYAIGKKQTVFALPRETRKIDFRAFSDAFKLKYVDATSINEVADKAFYYCTALEYVSLNKKSNVSDHKVFDHTSDRLMVDYKLNGKIYLVADIHGHIRLDILKRNLSRYPLTRYDVLLILGDAGIVWTEPMNPIVKAFYSTLPCDVLFIDGNHENYDLLYDVEVKMKYGSDVGCIEGNIFHLKRGNLYIINQYRFFAFGGAYSSKREHSNSPVYVWNEELPNEDEYVHGMNRITAANCVVDYVITHTGPKFLLSLMNIPIYEKETQLLNYLDLVKEKLKFTKWYFGHIHRDAIIDNFVCLYDGIEVID